MIAPAAVLLLCMSLFLLVAWRLHGKHVRRPRWDGSEEAAWRVFEKGKR